MARPAARRSGLAALRASVAGHAPFPITFTGRARFSPSVLFLRLGDETAVRALARAIHASFPDTPRYGGAFGDPTQHLTVAKAASDAELDRLEREIAPALAPHLPLVVKVEQIVVMEEDADGNWRDAARIPLATPA